MRRNCFLVIMALAVLLTLIPCYVFCFAGQDNAREAAAVSQQDDNGEESDSKEVDEEQSGLENDSEAPGDSEGMEGTESIESTEGIEGSEDSEEAEKAEETEETEGTEETEASEDPEGSEVEEQQKIPGIIETFSTVIPQSVKVDLKYDRYLTSLDYVLVTVSVGNVRAKPKFGAPVVGWVYMNQRPALLEEVKGEYSNSSKTDLWYRIAWEDNKGYHEGYIFCTLGESRCFQLDKMMDAVQGLKDEVDQNRTGFIHNYKNFRGAPPLYKGKTNDKYGYRRDQSAAGYQKPDRTSEFRYILDGMIVNIIGESNNFYKVTVPGFDGEYWVEKKYISLYNSIKKLTQAVVIDRKNQNEAVFEYDEDGWKLVSYSLATTGKKGPYSLLTPLGNFMAIEKRPQFWYYADGTTRVAGYAPYAVRFSGGGYIHGVPVDYIMKGSKRIDPGLIEYSSTIGTIPRSHMCVRNYTSHAQFIYEWIEIGKAAVIVIE